MKYVMFEVNFGQITKAVPVIFPNDVVHLIVARNFTRALEGHGWECRVVSAGDVTFEYARCSGKSESLGLTSRGRDSEIINYYDLWHGLEEAEPVVNSCWWLVTYRASEDSLGSVQCIVGAPDKPTVKKYLSSLFPDSVVSDISIQPSPPSVTQGYDTKLCCYVFFCGEGVPE